MSEPSFEDKIDEVFRLIPFSNTDSIQMQLSLKLREICPSYEQYLKEETVIKDKFFAWFWARTVNDVVTRRGSKANLMIESCRKHLSDEQRQTFLSMTLSQLIKITHEYDVFRIVLGLQAIPDCYKKRKNLQKNILLSDSESESSSISEDSSIGDLGEASTSQEAMNPDQRLVDIVQRIWKFRRLQYTLAHVYYQRVVEDTYYLSFMKKLSTLFLEKHDIQESNYYDIVVRLARSMIQKENGFMNIELNFIEQTYSPQAVKVVLSATKNEMDKNRTFPNLSNRKRRIDIEEEENDGDQDREAEGDNELSEQEIDFWHKHDIETGDEASTQIDKFKPHEEDYEPGQNKISNHPNQLYLILCPMLNLVKVGVTRMNKEELARRYNTYYCTVPDDVLFFQIKHPDLTRERLELLFMHLVSAIYLNYQYCHLHISA